MSSAIHSLLFLAPLLATIAHGQPATLEMRDNATLSSSACPTIWSSVASDLKSEFSGCNNLARSAIRLAFHDAAGYSSKTPAYGPASGGADGSVLLSNEEIFRPIEAPLQGFRFFLLDKYNQYHSQGVGAADLVQFAGSIGIRSCNGGPVVDTVVGRTDDSTAAPDGLLPEPFGPGSDYSSLVNLFEDKGFSPTDIAALVGAHTVSQAFAQRQNRIPPGGPQDTTPTTWDNAYFQQLQTNPRGVYHFASDVNLSQQNTTVGSEMARFAQDQEGFNEAFVSAMAKMSLLGISASVISGFVDCTALIQ